MITNTNSVWITVDSVDRVEENRLKEISGVLSVELDENIVKVSSSSDISNLDKIIHYFTSNQIPLRNVENKITKFGKTVFLVRSPAESREIRRRGESNEYISYFYNRR